MNSILKKNAARKNITHINVYINVLAIIVFQKPKIICGRSNPEILKRQKIMAMKSILKYQVSCDFMKCMYAQFLETENNLIRNR